MFGSRTRSLFVLALLAPLTASAAINRDIDGGTGGGGGRPPLDPGDGGGGTPPTPVLEKQYVKADLFGSSAWGAGYRLDGKLSAYAAEGGHKDKLAATMGLETYAKLNSGYYRVFSVRTTGSSEAKRRTDVSINAYAGSANVYTKSWGSATSTYTFLNENPFSVNATFINQSVTVSALFVPVTFTVKATGRLDSKLTGQISNVGIEASATPAGRASLYTSAAIGGQYCVGDACIGASAGVYADVTLVKASAPSKIAAWISFAKTGGVSLSWEVKSDVTLSTLDGEMGIFAEGCIIACKREELELLDWDGFDTSLSIFNMTGRYCLAGTCLTTVNNPPTSMGL